MIEPAIRNLLLAASAVNDVTEGRVWLGQRPQNERRPGVVLTRISGRDEQAIDGPAGYATGTVQAAVLAPDYRTAKELAAKVTAALDNYEGTVNETVIDWLSVVDESDIPAVPLEGKTSPTFGVALDIEFMIQR